MTVEEQADARLSAERDADDRAEFAAWVEAQYAAHLATEGMCEAMPEAA
jgi:hypothetical protein